MGTLDPRRNRGSSKTGRAAICGTAFESQRAERVTARASTTHAVIASNTVLLGVALRGA
jgi:hypothetical protein